MGDVSSIGQGHWGTLLHEGLKKHWVDIALIVSTVASLALVLLIQYGMIHPTFQLPYFGTITESCIKHLFEFGSGFFGSIALGKWIYQICQSIQTDTSSSSYPSALEEESETEEESRSEEDRAYLMNDLNTYTLAAETESEEKLFFLSPETEEHLETEVKQAEPIQPPIVEKIYSDSETSWWDRGTTSAHPCCYSFTLNGKLATLYGMYNAPDDSLLKIGEEIAQELQKTKEGDPLALEQKLNQILKGSDHHVVLKIEDQVIVSGNHFIITDKTIVKHENLKSSSLQIKENSKIFLILGDQETFNKISMRDIQNAYQDSESNKEHLAGRIYNRLDSMRDNEGVSLMVLAF